MRTIPLRPSGEAKVDDDDYEWLQHFIWRLNPMHGYAWRGIGNAMREDGTRYQKALYMHRFIMEPCDPFHIDHINGDRLDNRKCNLRMVSPTENAWNRDTRLTKKYSKYYGVSYVKTERVWTAGMTDPNKNRIKLGRFNTELEAAVAYDIASEKFWGSSARLNFPNGRPLITPQRRTQKPWKTSSFSVPIIGDTTLAAIKISHPNVIVREQIESAIREALQGYVMDLS